MKASLSYVRISPSKLRLVADIIRGKQVDKASSILKFSPKRGARFLLKLLNSSVANATLKPEVNADQLYIEKIIINKGVILKRFRAAPRGRATPIQKLTSHATIVLKEKTSKAIPKPKKSKNIKSDDKADKKEKTTPSSDSTKSKKEK